MKNKKFSILILSVVIATIIYSFTTIKTNQSTKDKIIGTWVSDKDINSKWVFSLDNTCKRYYNGVLLNTYSFSITNYSCNNELDSKYEYVKLLKSNQKTYCYAINGITKDGNDTYLSLEFDGNPRPMLFKKQ
ncbi:hypothetical protein [Polaribacter uvawellassae]|uniref:hypothetical protein n=1 Tax=Polaribacter uvawellassae TaxID=3133495 RepID=UPI00321B7F28